MSISEGSRPGSPRLAFVEPLPGPRLSNAELSVDSLQLVLTREAVTGHNAGPSVTQIVVFEIILAVHPIVFTVRFVGLGH